MGSKKGKKLVSIAYMEFRVLPEKYQNIGEVPGAFDTSMARSVFPMTHIKMAIKPRDKKKDEDAEAESYLKDE